MRKAVLDAFGDPTRKHEKDGFRCFWLGSPKTCVEKSRMILIDKQAYRRYYLVDSWGRR